MTPWIWGTVRLSTTAPQKPQNGSTAGRSTINQKGDKDLKIIEVKDRTQPLIEQLLKVWESTVYKGQGNGLTGADMSVRFSM